MPHPPLTPNACYDAYHTATTESLEALQPVVQLLSVRKVSTAQGNTPDRYRIIISDGKYFLQAMLATPLNPMVEDNSLRKNTIARLTKCNPQIVQTKKIVILWEIEVLDQLEDKIGDPENVEKAAAGAKSDAMQIDTPAAAPSTSTSVAPRPNQGGRSEKAPPIFPIEGLNPYQNRWTIKARVTYKSEKKKWSNTRGEGQLFSVNLMDETSEIKATAFHNAVDTLYELLEEGKVYYITKAKVVLAKKAFSQLPNDYEITMDIKTEVTECTDTTNVPMVQYNFVELGDLPSRQKDSVIDVLAIVHQTGECSEIMTKNGKPLSKRELTLVDRSQVSVNLTLWGKTAEDWNHTDKPVVAFKGAKVGDYNGRSLSAFSTTSVAVNPEIDQSYSLRGWYDVNSEQTTFQAISGMGGGSMAPRAVGLKREEMMTLLDVKDSDLEAGGQNFSARATITNIKEQNIAYPACRTEKCNKKVTNEADPSIWICDKCNGQWDRPEYRYLLGMLVTDHTEQAWFQSFNESGIQIMGITANELIELKEEDEAKFSQAIQRVQGKTFNFVCRAKTDTFNDQTRVRYGVNQAIELDYAAECRALHKTLAGYHSLLPVTYT